MTTRRTALKLTDAQLRIIERAARSLPVRERDMFRHGVISRLAGEPSSTAVTAAINAALDHRIVLLGNCIHGS